MFLVSVLMIVYYRWFGVLAVAALALSTALLWSIIAFLGETKGLALTLAVVTGFVVSIGVTTLFLVRPGNGLLLARKAH